MSGRNDTIAAIATASGRGGIGIVRISGRDLLGMAEALSGRRPPPRRAVIADFCAADGVAIDQGILLYFPAPHSFTGEDVLELQGHGGTVVLHMLLARCLELGARLAQPGEFSQRAFLNEKIDLVQAEAVADLIDATTTAAARSALRSLSGEFSREIHDVLQALIDLRLRVEATLDFPEEELDEPDPADIRRHFSTLQDRLARLQRRANAGKVLRSGLHVVLAGLPNVGKSSLLNRLAGEERAIVTPIAGTTRDALRETIQVEGIPLHIVDTAGLRDTDDYVEGLGIDRSWREIERADVIFQLIDARAGVAAADLAIAAKFPPGVEHVLIENKCDLADLPPQRRQVEGRVHLRLSAKNGDGMELLHDELLRIAGWSNHGEDVILARTRHLEALAACAERIDTAALQQKQLELCAE